MKFLSRVVVAVLLTISLQADDVMPEELKQKAVDAINQFVKTLQANDYETSAKLVAPMVHKSLLNRRRDGLSRNVYEFSFKKAHTNARHYLYPVVITRIQKLKTTGIGYKESGEKGTEYKLWIDKKPASAGVPAPLVVFFAEGSQEAKLCYVGGL